MNENKPIVREGSDAIEPQKVGWHGGFGGIGGEGDVHDDTHLTVSYVGDAVTVGVGYHHDRDDTLGTSAHLTPGQAREAAASLEALADHLEERTTGGEQ